MKQLIELIEDKLPNRPYCTDDLGRGLRIRGRAEALAHRYIQINSPHTLRWLVFDVDRPDAGASWLDANLPEPTWITQSPESGHAHIVYELTTPVVRTAAARTAPLRYAAAIDEGITAALGADTGYAGLISKNPLHGSWRTLTPSEHPTYSLGELAEYVSLRHGASDAAIDSPIDGHRNCALFEQLRAWAYKRVGEYQKPGGFDAWHAVVLDKAQSLNAFTTPLPRREVRSVATSVARWVWKHYTPDALRDLIARTHSSEIQAARGARKGARKRDCLLPMVKAMAALGHSQAGIARELDIPRRTVGTWLKRY